MDRRCKEWHDLQDEVARQFPNTIIHRTGWQRCFIINKYLSAEKAVDIGLVTEWVAKQNHYDTALLMSSDGDFVPAIKLMRSKGQQVGHVEYFNRDGDRFDSNARRLKECTDFTFEFPYLELQKLLGISTEPVVKKKDIRRAEQRAKWATEKQAQAKKSS